MCFSNNTCGRQDRFCCATESDSLHLSLISARAPIKYDPHLAKRPDYDDSRE
jgi:hypothetical protein